MLQAFEIIPFQENNVIDWIRGEFEIREQEISISYQLSGKISEIFWPDQQVSTTREVGLWEHTCLEFFIGPTTTSNYWEFNLSPNGNWNCFSFSDLRCDRQESEALVLVSFSSEFAEDNATCTARIRCNDISLEAIRIGVSAVIEHEFGLFYYALAHRSSTKRALTQGGKTPDFHARENHLLLH